MNDLKKIILSSYKLYDRLTGHMSRPVQPCMYLGYDEFLYFNKKGDVRMVDTKDGSIWACDRDRGFPFMKKIRTVKGFIFE